MRSFARECLIWASVAALSSGAFAQSAAPDSITGNAAPQLKGVNAFEQFGVGNSIKPFNLRFQNIYPSSEFVSINNQGLVRNQDYTIDYIKGVLVILKQVTPGQIIRVSYQHDPSGGYGFIGSNGLALPSSVVGANPSGQSAKSSPSVNRLSFQDAVSGGPLAGDNLLLFNGVNSGGGSLGMAVNPFHNGPTQGALNDAHLIVQNLSTRMLHGNVSFNYQDISPTFLGFNSAAASGTSADALNAAAREVGIKRMGFSMQDVAIGNTKLSDAFRMVSDGSGKISWESFALDSGPLKLSYNARQVGAGFTRFADLSESDRDTLLQEAGISRQEINGQYSVKGGALSFSSNLISDSIGQKIQKQDFSLNMKGLKIDAGDQSVGPRFMEFGSLSSDEQKTWSNQVGMGKRWFNLETSPIGKGGQPLKISSEAITSTTGSYQSSNASAGGKNWSVQVASNKSSSNFGLTANLQDAQIDDEIKNISTLYAPTAVTPGPGDRAAFLGQSTLARSGFRFTFKPLKTDSFDLEAVALKGASDSANIESFSAATKSLSLTADHEHVGSNFNEINQLMSFEQQKLGMDLGVDKTDANMSLKLGGSKMLTAALMNTNTPQGDASRNSVEFSDKRIDISIVNRDVSPGFSTANTLPDPEAGMLAALNGFRDQIIQGKWQPSSKMTLQGVWETDKNATQNVDNFQHDLFFTWDPNKTTHLAYTFMDTKSDNPLSVLFENRISNLLFTKDFGKGGKLQYVHQDSNVVDPSNGGSPTTVAQQAPPPDLSVPQGSSSQDQLTYTANLDKNTSIQTQDTQTKFSDGSKETVSANTINRTLTPHFGVSYTDLYIDKPGKSNDENKNNYGFWFDLGKGLRFSYGFVRDVNEPQGNQSDTTIGMTPGNLGPLQIVNSSYQVNSFDNVHNQVTSNFALKTSKPFNLGPLKEMQFNLGMDTASDYSVYSRKNEMANVSGKIGANSFMLEYRSQIDPSGRLGTDRFFSFQTDPNPKKWIEGSVKFKERDLPGQAPLAIRDFSLTLRPIRNLSITNHMLTNPEEEFRPDVLMGSVTSPWRLNAYALDYKTSTSTSIGATWDERFNDSTRDYFRTAGLDVQLFKNTGSPLTLWFGMESGGGQTVSHQYAQRFYVKYFRQPGPNQSLNLFAGNISYAYTNGTQFSKNNWSLFADYEYSFWTGSRH